MEKTGSFVLLKAALQALARYSKGNGSVRVGRWRAGKAANFARDLNDKVSPSVVFAAARGLIGSSDAIPVAPNPAIPAGDDPKRVRIGLFGNLANNLYNALKGLRNAGYDAELIVQNGGIDKHPMAQPFWEDMSLECENFDQSDRYRSQWTAPAFVRQTDWSEGLQARFYGRMSAVGEVTELYRDHFGREISPDVALLLAHNMGHWEYLSQMSRYDVVLLSSAAIALGVFAPCPYAVFPTGGDLFESPFDERNLEGLLMNLGYRRSRLVMRSGPYWRHHLQRLGVLDKTVHIPLFLDTSVYAQKDEPDLRQSWKQELGGSVFVLAVCRQAWRWKRNDILIKAFAAANHPKMRLILSRWGDDVERSEALVRKLGIESKVLWLPIGSKPVVRARQRAADVVVDQLAGMGHGTSITESMAAGKPVIINYREPEIDFPNYSRPPIVQAATINEVKDALIKLVDSNIRTSFGRAGREWVQESRSNDATAEKFGQILVEQAF